MKSDKIIVASMAFFLLVSGSPVYARVISHSDVVKEMKERSLGVQMTRAHYLSQSTAILASRAPLDTRVVGAADHSVDKSAKTSTLFGNREDTTNWSLGLEKRFAFGMTSHLDFTNQRDKLYGASAFFPSGPTYGSTVAFSFEQSLLRDGFGYGLRSSIREAEKGVDVAGAVADQSEAHLVHSALGLYWRWATAFRQVQNATARRRDANQFLSVTQEKNDLGMADTADLLGAKAQVATAEQLVHQWQIAMGQAEEQLRNQLSVEPAEVLTPAENDAMHDSHRDWDVAKRVEYAMSHRPDYVADQKHVEQLNLQVSRTSNGRWPSLDLVGSMALNEIASNYSDAVSGTNHPAMKVGVQLSIPIENRLARSEHKRSEHDRAEALLKLKQSELKVANEVTRANREVTLRQMVWRDSEKKESLLKGRLKQEMADYQRGRSSSATIVQYQNELIQASQEYIENQYLYFQSVADMMLAEYNME